MVCEKLKILRESLPDDCKLAYLHRIDNVLFSHGGLTDAFVHRYVPTEKAGDIDAVINTINGFGCGEMWQGAERPVDVRLAPTGAERRPPLRSGFARNIMEENCISQIRFCRS